MKPHESPRINKKSIRGDSGDSWPVWNMGIKRTFQTSSLSVVAYLSGKLKPRTYKAMREHIVGQIPTLKPRYVLGIPNPKGAGLSNYWCMKYFLSHHVSSEGSGETAHCKCPSRMCDNICWAFIFVVVCRIDLSAVEVITNCLSLISTGIIVHRLLLTYLFRCWP